MNTCSTYVGPILGSLMLMVLLGLVASLVMVVNIDFFIKHTSTWKIPMWRRILAFHKHQTSIDGGIS